MKSKKITAAVLGIVLTFGLVVSGCGNNNGASSDGSAKAETNKDGYEVVSIGFPSAGYEWAEGALAVAEEKGYLDEYLNPLGYDADLIPFTGAAPAIHEALVSGDLDYAYYAGFAGIMATSNGIDTKLLTVTSFGSVWQLAVSADSGITSLQDLKGKTISYQRGATPQMYVLKVLEEAGLTENDVQLVNSTIPEGLSSLSTGAVDAAVVTYGQADTLVEQGKATILHKGVEADPDVFYEPNVLIGRSDYISANSDVSVAIIKAMLKAKDDIVSDPEAFYEFYKEKMMILDAKPNAAHLKLAELEQAGKLQAVVTQNIDGLHQAAGSKNVLELHGSVYRNYCEICKKEYNLDFILESEGIPHCTCGGIIKPDVVLYEEALDMNILNKSAQYIMSADTLIVGGTSLVVYPAAGLINYFKGKNLVLINKSQTDYDNLATLVINEAIGETLAKIK